MRNIYGWNLDNNSKTAIYLQIADQIKSSIISGNLKEKTKLSQRYVANIFGTSRQPVTEAFQLLAAEGYISITPQSGSEVINNVWLKLNEPQISLWGSLCDIGRHKASPTELMKVFEKMDEEHSIKINGDRLASSFECYKPLAKALGNVTKQLYQTDDFNQFNRGGYMPLKTELVKHMARIGVKASTDQILVTAGIGESLSMIASGFCGQGINFFYESPSFLNTIMVMQSSGVNLIPVPLDDEGIDATKLIIKLKNSHKSILYVQPLNHNPTGTHMTKERRNLLLSTSVSMHVPIIENDMLRDFVFHKIPQRPLKAFDTTNNIIYIGTLFSGFMGYKLSWIVAGESIINRLKDIKTHYELVPNVLLEMIATDLLSTGTYYEYFDSLRVKAMSQFNFIQECLKKYLTGIATWNENLYSYYIWLKFNNDVNVIKMFNATNEYLFYPGVMLDREDTHHVRLNTLGTKTDDVEKWIKKISQLAKACY